MKFISPKVHGILDYSVAIALIGALMTQDPNWFWALSLYGLYFVVRVWPQQGN